MEILKQLLDHPLALEEKVFSLLAATQKLMLCNEKSEIKGFQLTMLQLFEIEHKDIIDTIETQKVLTDELIEQIVTYANDYASNYNK